MEFFGETYLQPTGGPRFHDMPHVLNQLTDACSDFSSSYADHHAFRRAVERFSAAIRGTIAGTYMRAFLHSAPGHVWNYCHKWVVGCKMCGAVELEARDFLWCGNLGDLILSISPSFLVFPQPYRFPTPQKFRQDTHGERNLAHHVGSQETEAQWRYALCGSGDIEN